MTGCSTVAGLCTDLACPHPDHTAPAEHVATLVARSPGRVVSMTCSCGVSVVGDVMPFAGVTRLMLEHLNGGKSDAVMRDVYGPSIREVGRPRFAHGYAVSPPPWPQELKD